MHSVDSRRRSAVIYARVSSDEQERRGFRSRPRQSSSRTTPTVKDFRSSASTSIRKPPEPWPSRFNEMVGFLPKQTKIANRHGRCRVLLVEKTDRLYRNLKDYVTIDDLEIEIHFVKEGVVLSPDSHSSEKFMHGIKVGMAKAYVDNLSEEVKKGMREKAEQGIWPPKAPLGYRNVVGPSGKKQIEPDPSTAPLVVPMFEGYATGNCSLVQSPKWPGGRFALGELTTSVRPFTPSSGTGVLRGLCLEGKVYKGVHTPLITRQLWERCQDVLTRRGTRKPRRVKHDFAFSHLITCGHCGCALVGELKKERYTYYHCTGYKGKCPDPYVREEVLEDEFADILRQIRFDSECWNGSHKLCETVTRTKSASTTKRSSDSKPSTSDFRTELISRTTISWTVESRPISTTRRPPSGETNRREFGVQSRIMSEPTSPT